MTLKYAKIIIGGGKFRDNSGEMITFVDILLQ